MAAEKFQFQYGTIKRTQQTRLSGEIAISIPVWYD